MFYAMILLLVKDDKNNEPVLALCRKPRKAISEKLKLA